MFCHHPNTQPFGLGQATVQGVAPARLVYNRPARVPILRRASDDGIIYTDSDTSSEAMAVSRPQSYPWVRVAIRGPVRYPTDGSANPRINPADNSWPIPSSKALTGRP